MGPHNFGIPDGKLGMEFSRILRTHYLGTPFGPMAKRQATEAEQLFAPRIVHIFGEGVRKGPGFQVPTGALNLQSTE